MSSECNNIKLVIRNDKSKVIYAMCKQCLITANHDVCVLNYVNDMNSHGKKQKENVLNTEKQKKQKPKVMKPKKVGSNKRLASPKPSKPRSCLRWSPTGILFDLKGKIIPSSESKSQFDCSNSDNACTSNPSEPTIKRFPNSTSFLGRFRVAFRRNRCFIKNLKEIIIVKRKAHKKPLPSNIHEYGPLHPQFAPLGLVQLLPRKSKRASHPPKPVPNSKQRLHLLHMDLCGPMRIIQLMKAPEVIKTFLKRITVNLQSPVIIVRTENDTEFKNQILKEYFDSVGISHQASSVKTPQQNGVVERRNRNIMKDNEFLDSFYLYAKGVLDLYCSNLCMSDHVGGQPSAALRIVPAAQAPQVL
ncbi:retrovirus-related pol polyprotein from transposon TNT 1-94 [Tanacetum coccineum]|uniref:Retrovirus-related pol polyprotein from transposon TNT 1-94 n=1 Tax=Tanacetum coccineum TaxID=301880 RepID=A0ABQ5AHN5_9ASTR